MNSLLDICIKNAIRAACEAGQFSLAREQARILADGHLVFLGTLEEDIAEAESLDYQAGDGVIAAYVNQSCPF